MESYAAAPNRLSSIEKKPSAQEIEATLSVLKNDAAKRKELYMIIDRLEQYVSIDHDPETGINVQQIKFQIEDNWHKLHEIFEPRETDNEDVRVKINARERLIGQVDFGDSQVDSRMVEVRRRIKDREKDILVERAKVYAMSNDLGNYVSTEKFPHPGIPGVFGGDILDVKTVADGARPMAILGAELRPHVNDLLEMNGSNLSRIKVGTGMHASTIICNAEGLKAAQKVADILDTHNDMSSDPRKIYEFHKEIGTLMKMNAVAVDKMSLAEARKADPTFDPAEN